MTLDAEQKHIATGILGAVAFSAIVLTAGYFFYPFAQRPLTTAGDRLAFALKADLFLFLWLAFAIGQVANGRFFSPDDIAGSGFAAPGQAIALKSAFLQNTLEQVVLAFGVHLGLAVVLRGFELVLIPVAVVLFCIGRLAFLVGYARGAGARSFGFATTFYPSIFLLALAILLFLIRG